MAHYAISELIISLAAIWAARFLWPHNLRWAAFGFLVFGAAAAIGVVRFPAGLIEEWAAMHRWAGTMGGLLAMQALTQQTIASDKLVYRVHLLLSVLALVASVALPVLRVPLFLIWSIAFIWRVSGNTPEIEVSRFMKACIAGLMLFNVIVFRQSPFMAPAVSWHIFHVLLALWILGVTRLLVHPHLTATKP
jgi:hypothetical protein